MLFSGKHDILLFQIVMQGSMMLILQVAAEQSKFCLWTMLPDALLTHILDLFSTLWVIMVSVSSIIIQ